MSANKWADNFGWFIEKGFIWLTCSLYVLIFIGNRIMLYWGLPYSSPYLEKQLFNYYDLMINPNIGTITTIASIFVGIYVTVLTVLGGIKANSIMALLSNNDLKKVVHYILTGLAGSFIVVFYSFFAITIKHEFLRDFIFFYLVIYMILTALRLGLNLAIIYKHDLGRLSENLEQEKKDAEKHKLIMNSLEKYLLEKDAERIRSGK